MKRKITWNKQIWNKPKTRCQAKNDENIINLNEKQILILSSLLNQSLSSLDICKNINWISNTGKIPTAYLRYLKEFKLKELISSFRVVINGKSNIKYKLTEKGIKLINEKLSFYNKTYKK